MIIDITKGELTLENVRLLIASKDDSRSRQIRVSLKGVVYVSDDVGNENLDGVLFRMETIDEGTDYIGLNASNDDKWVEQVYFQLKCNWPKPLSSHIGELFG